MKFAFFSFLILVMSASKAQSISIPTGVYCIDSTSARMDSITRSGGKLDGSTTDVQKLSVHMSTLAPGKTNHAPRALPDREELVIVKEGRLTIIINDSSYNVGPGSLALIVAGDMQSFQNRADHPATYYVIGFTAKLPANISRGHMQGGSLVKEWSKLTVTETTKGQSRPLFDRPTSMFNRMEVHVTTLNPGQESHLPHHHRAEEIMFLIDGTFTMNLPSQKVLAMPGCLVLVRPDDIHNLVNTGNKPCTYYAIKWYND